jgi:hypothetical protein
MTKKPLILAVSLLLSLLPAFNAQAADQCLAQFPDTAWSKGEPQNVSVLLNRDLVRTQVAVIRNLDGKNLPTSIPTSGIDDIIPTYLQNSAIQYVGKVGFKEISYPVSLIYEYKGSGCTVRKIKIDGGSVSYKPFDFSEISDETKNLEMLKAFSDRNFLEIEKAATAFKALSNYLDSTKNSPIKIPANRPNDDYSLAWILGIEQLLSSLLIASTPIVTSDDKCLEVISEKWTAANKRVQDSFSPVEISQNVWSDRLPGFWEKLLFNSSNKVCKLTVSFGVGGFLGPLSTMENRQKITPVRVSGSVWVQPASVGSPALPKTTSGTKTVITCVKGKLSTRVTAVKPKCPSGYKLKK